VPACRTAGRGGSKKPAEKRSRRAQTGGGSHGDATVIAGKARIGMGMHSWSRGLGRPGFPATGVVLIGCDPRFKSVSLLWPGISLFVEEISLFVEKNSLFGSSRENGKRGRKPGGQV
jgi:hypothetical protein